MPVQINEVIIKAVVDAAPVANNIQPDAFNNPVMNSGIEIAEKILEILKEKQER